MVVCEVDSEGTGWWKIFWLKVIISVCQELAFQLCFHCHVNELVTLILLNGMQNTSGNER